MEKKLTIKLFGPGMSHLHRVGLAGLYMTLQYFDKVGIAFDNSKWTLEDDQVTLFWQGEDRTFFDQLFKASFSATEQGWIDFAAYRSLAIGDLEKFFLNESLLMTYLQHNKQHKIPKGANKTISLNYEDKSIVISYKPFNNSYAHTQAVGDITNKKGVVKEFIPIKSWLYPGAAERHSGLSRTEIEETPDRFLALLYAPVGSLFYRLAHKGRDGKYDKRLSAAVVVPHVVNLELYCQSYQQYLESPIETLYADGLSDAALSAMVTLKTENNLQELGVDGCTVFTMGTMGWAKQQKTRSSVTVIETYEEETLNTFDMVLHCLPNKMYINTSGKYFVLPSLSRGLIANNIAAGKEFYRGFWELMSSKEQAKTIRFENRRLNQMINEDIWTSKSDRQFVEAIHRAIKNRYGALASRTKPGEDPPFAREFERMRTGLMRCKNAQTLRAELADIFARGGINTQLQKNWQQLLPLFTGNDWQKTRDLTLFALASYSGEGSDKIIEDSVEIIMETDEMEELK